YYEMYSPIDFGSEINLGPLGSDAGKALLTYPFGGGSFQTDSVVYSTQIGLVPAIAFTTKMATGVKTVSKPWADVSIYPNPAVDNFTVSVGLDHVAKNITYTVLDALAN